MNKKETKKEHLKQANEHGRVSSQPEPDKRNHNNSVVGATPHRNSHRASTFGDWLEENGRCLLWREPKCIGSCCENFSNSRLRFPSDDRKFHGTFRASRKCQCFKSTFHLIELKCSSPFSESKAVNANVYFRALFSPLTFDTSFHWNGMNRFLGGDKLINRGRFRPSSGVGIAKMLKSRTIETNASAGIDFEFVFLVVNLFVIVWFRMNFAPKKYKQMRTMEARERASAECVDSAVSHRLSRAPQSLQSGSGIVCASVVVAAAVLLHNARYLLRILLPCNNRQ